LQDRQRRVLPGPFEARSSRPEPVAVKLSLGERHGIKLRGYSASFRDIPLRCSQGSIATVDLLSPKVTYRRHTHGFAAAVVTLTAPSGTQAVWFYEGRRVGEEFARGTVKVRDREFEIGTGQTDDCSSGELRWSASLEQAAD
jgi:hypothetical protein